MSDDKVAFLFPAFGMKYRHFVMEALPGYRQCLDRFVRLASALVSIDLDKFSLATTSRAINDSQDDFQKHYVCYINSCALSDFLKERRVVGDYVAGYSMGLFASLYHAGSVSFEHGLLLMHHVCKSAHEISHNGSYGMGVVVGLPYRNIADLIKRHCEDLEVADVTIDNVIIASGKRSQLQTLFEAANAQGALQSRLLPVGLPYHSSMMNQAEKKIRAFLKEIEIRDPEYGIVSCVTQNILLTADDVHEEVAGNVVYHLNWRNTMQKMLDLGVRVFVECGLSEGLCKLSKFFKGSSRAFHPKTFRKLFKDGVALSLLCVFKIAFVLIANSSWLIDT
jgi:[acyl-carrier-protein] S-malonyltransferase